MHATGSNYMPKAITDRRPMSAAYFEERLLADPGLWGIPIGNRGPRHATPQNIPMTTVPCLPRLSESGGSLLTGTAAATLLRR